MKATINVMANPFIFASLGFKNIGEIVQDNPDPETGDDGTGIYATIHESETFCDIVKELEKAVDNPTFGFNTFLIFLRDGAEDSEDWNHLLTEKRGYQYDEESKCYYFDFTESEFIEFAVVNDGAIDVDIADGLSQLESVLANGIAWIPVSSMYMEDATELGLRKTVKWGVLCYTNEGT